MAVVNYDEEQGIISGINVTPLVDITLVLLIIFMVTAKIITSSALPMTLPNAVQGQQVDVAFGVDLYASGELRVNGEPIAPGELLARASDAHARNNDLRVIIRADGSVPHSRVIQALDSLKGAGITRIGFGVSPIPPPTPATP